MPVRAVHSKAGHHRSRSLLGRPRKSSPAIGRSVSPVAVRTQAATADAAWVSTATLWGDQPSTTAGEVISFAARGVLLLVILQTMELPAMKGVLQ